MCVVVLLSSTALACAPSASGQSSAPSASAAQSAASDSQSTRALSLIDPRLRAVWPDDPDSTAWFDSGGYQMYARHPGEFVAIRAPMVAGLDDVAVSGTFRKIGGPPGGGYGLIVRDGRLGSGDGIDQSGEFIVAAVGDIGQVGIWRREADRWLDIVPWTTSPLVHRGGDSNELTVDVLGSRLRFMVNSVEVGNVEAPLRTGRVGVFVGGDFNQVMLERLVVRPRSTTVGPDPADAYELATVGSRLAQISVDVKQAPEHTAVADPGTRMEFADLVDSLRTLTQEVSAEFDTGSRQSARIQHVSTLLAYMEADVAAAVSGFSDGFDTPRSPVNNRSELNRAASHLQAAGHTAEEIRAELQAIRGDLVGQQR